MRAATPEAQKRRSGHIDRVRPTPVGSIVAHETIVVGRLRAFLRGANRRPAVQEAIALFRPSSYCGVPGCAGGVFGCAGRVSDGGATVGAVPDVGSGGGCTGVRFNSV